MQMSDAMARALLRKHATGDFGEHRWATINKLFRMGMIAGNEHIIVTPKGVAWCMEHHMEHAF